tara:strand:- start:83 stop:205 length:123 start_codon:yes stop_codon:yes gene_type:complete
VGTFVRLTVVMVVVVGACAGVVRLGVGRQRVRALEAVREH